MVYADDLILIVLNIIQKIDYREIVMSSAIYNWKKTVSVNKYILGLQLLGEYSEFEWLDLCWLTTHSVSTTWRYFDERFVKTLGTISCNMTTADQPVFR